MKLIQVSEIAYFTILNSDALSNFYFLCNVSRLELRKLELCLQKGTLDLSYKCINLKILIYKEVYYASKHRGYNRI